MAAMRMRMTARMRRRRKKRKMKMIRWETWTPVSPISGHLGPHHEGGMMPPFLGWGTPILGEGLTFGVRVPPFGAEGAILGQSAHILGQGTLF